MEKRNYASKPALKECSLNTKGNNNLQLQERKEHQNS
jgi:hypothetical protein